jgi:hypothetical protein
MISEMSAEIVADLCTERRCRDELIRQDSVRKLFRLLSTSRSDMLRGKSANAVKLSVCPRPCTPKPESSPYSPQQSRSACIDRLVRSLRTLLKVS